MGNTETQVGDVIEMPSRKTTFDTDTWETPPDVFEAAAMRWGPYELDVAASRRNTKCPRFIGAEQDAIATLWDATRCWCNPPYSQPNLELFMGRARYEGAERLVTCLVPATTEAGWWHEHILRGGDVVSNGTILHGRLRGSWMRFEASDCAIEVLLLRGRIRFLEGGKPKGSPKTGSALVTFMPRRMR